MKQTKVFLKQRLGFNETDKVNPKTETRFNCNETDNGISKTETRLAMKQRKYS